MERTRDGRTTPPRNGMAVIRAATCVVAIACAALCVGCGGTAVSQMVGPSPDRCQAQVTGIPQSVPSSGAQLTATIGTTRDCTWSVTTGASWLQASPASGQGGSSIQLTVAENPDASSRSATITVNGAQFNLTQQPAPCRFQIDSASRAVPAPSGSITVAVTAGGGCSWTASSAVSWLHGVRTSGSGSGTAEFSVDANAGATRTGNLTVAGLVVTVSQAAGTTDPAPPPPSNPNPNPSPVGSAVSLNGTVSNLSGSCPSLTFVVSGTRVVTDSGTRFNLGSCSDVRNGVSVQVDGVLQASGADYASKVQLKKK